MSLGIKHEHTYRIGLIHPGSRAAVLLVQRISRGHVFLAVFFRVTHDGLSERGTTHSLIISGITRFIEGPPDLLLNEYGDPLFYFKF